jgi:hypothetical protein
MARPRKAWTNHEEKLGVVDPLHDSFRAANRDGDVSGPVRLADQADRDAVAATAWVHIRREVVCINRRHNCVGSATRGDLLPCRIPETGRLHVVSGAHELREFDGLAQVHDFLLSIRSVHHK